MSDNQEFETTPVTPSRLQPARHFAASYAGEHVAGTEFVIGATFVAWGVSTTDILWGLLWGNLLAVLTWGLLCAPIAVDTRLTLYAYLKRIAGAGTIRIYSVVNGILFCVLAGAMITVSASAVRIVFGIPAQVNWYPSHIGFVLVALGVGAVVVAIAVKGFRRVAQFAEICSPWMILMFVVGALAMYPLLREAVSGPAGDSFVAVGNQFIWRGDNPKMTIWHVAAFAWICNLAMHGGMSDMTVLRYARRFEYGFFSALGMFVGHYLAWVAAGIMGAGAAMLLHQPITALDPGAVAYQALDAAGILAVIIAGWTTSNPTIYRAGLAFHSLNTKWNRAWVTAITGAVTTVVACFPFVFSKLMDFVGLMGLLLVPIGAIIVTEHWLFPRLGLTRYWSYYRGQTTNVAALVSWLLALLAAWLLNHVGVHLFFLLLPVWGITTLVYCLLAWRLGAAATYGEADEYEAEQRQRKDEEQVWLAGKSTVVTAGQALVGTSSKTLVLSFAVAMLALMACLALGVAAFVNGDLQLLRQWLWLPTAMYFVAATCWVVKHTQAGDGNHLGGNSHSWCT